MDFEALTVPLPEIEPGELSAALHPAAGSSERPAVLLAHGAGAGMDSGFLVHLAKALSARGLPTLRFQYPYMERMTREGKRRPPDRMPKLQVAHRAALEALRERFPGRPCLLAGKSMGGRVGSLLAALGEGAGLILFGYPLHPAREPEKRRDEHFPMIAQPCLFLQGTRDALCELPLLERSLEGLGGSFELEVIEGANHDFQVPKRSGRTHEEVLDELAERADEWVARRFPT